MSEQLSLVYEAEYRDQQAWRRVVSEVERVLAHVGRQTFCYEVQTTEPRLSNALNGRERSPFHAAWLVYLLRCDPTTGLAAALADVAGCEVKRRETLTDAQKVARYEAAVERLPPAMRDAFRKEAGL